VAPDSGLSWLVNPDERSSTWIRAVRCPSVAIFESQPSDRHWGRGPEFRPLMMKTTLRGCRHCTRQGGKRSQQTIEKPTPSDWRPCGVTA
jgi:hypothetical protein